MGGNSANIKALIAVVYTIFITILIAVKELKQLSIELDIVIIVSSPINLNLKIPLEKQLRDT